MTSPSHVNSNDPSSNWKQRAKPVDARPAANASIPEHWESVDIKDIPDQQPSPQGGFKRLLAKISWVEWSALIVILAVIIAALTSKSLAQRKIQEIADAAARAQAENPESVDQQFGAGTFAELGTASSSGMAGSEPALPSGKEVANNVVSGTGGESFALGESGSVDFAASSLPKPGSLPKSGSAGKGINAVVPAPPIGQIRALNRPATPPAKQPTPRAALEIPTPGKAPFQFSRIYETAYDTMQKYNAAKKNPSPESDELLLTAITQFRQCLMRPAEEIPDNYRGQILFTLASLLNDAGHPYQAMVYVQTILGLKEANMKTKHAAGSLGFGVMQNAHTRHFGRPERGGELKRMTELCDLIAQQAKGHPQLPTMRYATAQRLDQATWHVRAAKVYSRIPKTAPLYAQAQLAAGRAFWSEAALRESTNQTTQVPEIISCAERSLRTAVAAYQEKSETSETLLAGKMTLAQIYLRRDQADKAIELLDTKTGLLKDIADGTKMSEAFVTAVQEMLLSAYHSSGQLNEVQATLAELEKQYGPEATKKLASRYKSLASNLTTSLQSAPIVTLTDAKNLDRILQESLQSSGDRPSVQALLRTAEAWLPLLSKAEDEACRNFMFSQADQALGQALKDKSLSEGELLSLQLKRIDLAINTGNTTEALGSIGKLLQDNPNIIQLQLIAAKLLTDTARKNQTFADWSKAINGIPDQSIWGWGRLNQSLTRLHLDSDDPDRYFERMMQSAVSLNECRLVAAGKANDSQTQQKLVNDARKHVKQLNSTLSREGNPFAPELKLLQERLQ